MVLRTDALFFVLVFVILAGSVPAQEAAPAPKQVTGVETEQRFVLLRKVGPRYPPLARQARIQGTVLLAIRIDQEGNVAKLELISGHPMLAGAAMDAVMQWKYKPYVSNGQPVEVETQVQVSFALGGR